MNRLVNEIVVSKDFTTFRKTAALQYVWGKKQAVKRVNQKEGGRCWWEGIVWHVFKYAELYQFLNFREKGELVLYWHRQTKSLDY